MALLYGRVECLAVQNGGFRTRRAVWRIDSCACMDGAACSISGQPWLRLSKCSSTLGPQASEVLVITFVAPTAVGQYAHALQIDVPARCAPF